VPPVESGVSTALRSGSSTVSLSHETPAVSSWRNRKSEAAIARAQRRIDQKQIRRTSKGSAEAREYACYVMVFSTLPPTEADGARVLECYRLRWQIELTFKRLKSILQLGHVPKQDDASSRAWLYAKLLVALLAERLTRVGSAISPWGYYLDAVSQNS
jgi:Transposase DDE domain